MCDVMVCVCVCAYMYVCARATGTQQQTYMHTDRGIIIKTLVREHYVYKGALNKKYFDNRIKAVPNSEYVLITEMRLTMREYKCAAHKRVYLRDQLWYISGNCTFFSPIPLLLEWYQFYAAQGGGGGGKQKCTKKNRTPIP